MVQFDGGGLAVQPRLIAVLDAAVALSPVGVGGAALQAQAWVVAVAGLDAAEEPNSSAATTVYV
jgi:hypothetical protein